MKKLLSLVALMGLLSFVGCGGDDEQAAGSSTIQGNILSYDTDALAGVVVTYPQTVVHPAPITVSLQGTSFSAQTQGDGIFVHQGIPPGNYVMVFSLGGRQLGSYQITVAADVIIVLHNLVIGRTGAVSVSATTITPRATAPTGASIEGVWHGNVQGDGITGNGEIFFTFNGDGTFTAQAADGGGHGTYSVSGNTVSGTILGGPGDVNTQFSGHFTTTAMHLSYSAPRTGGGTDTGIVDLTKK